MFVLEVDVPSADVVFVKGIIEASDGIATVFAECGGELTLASPPDRKGELVALIVDLEQEIGLRRRGVCL